MYRLQLCLLIASLLSFVVADISLSKPAAGQTFSGSDGTISIDISWSDDTDDSSSDFSLTKAKTFVISLCTGVDSNIQCFLTLQKATTLGDKTSYEASFANTACADGYYFFQIYTTFPEDQNTIHYSSRFELTDMSGSSGTLTAPYTVTGAPPAAQTEFNGAANSIDSKSFTIYYTSQTGSWRFAPMQLQPGTTITATTWHRKYPTSAVSYFSTKVKSPSIKSTITPGWSYTIKSVHNWATIAPYPTVAYPAKDRVTSASLSKASNKRRWLD